MDPVTAITIAITIIRGGIAIYQAIHDHKDSTPAVKAAAKACIEHHEVALAAAETLRDHWQGVLAKEVSAP